MKKSNSKILFYVLEKFSQITFFVIFNYGFSQTVEKYSIDSGGATVSAGNIELLYTIGEVNIHETTVGNISISEGFINPLHLRILVNLAALLQGPLFNPNTGEETLMRDNLRLLGFVPTISPYTDALTCNSNVFSIVGSNAIIDWVWVELRDNTDGTTVIKSTSALIQRDGDIVDVDGIAPLTFSNITPNNYYVVVSHRNHLGVITSNPVNLVAGFNSIDLTSNSNSVFGGTNAIKDLGNGKFALFAGDFNGDGQVQNTDKSAVEPLRGISGYNNADIDMNGEVQNTDLNSLLNPNIGKGKQYTGKRLFAKRKK